MPAKIAAPHSARYSASAPNADAADDRHAVAGHQVAQHLRVLAGDRGADVGQHAGRQAELGGERVERAGPGCRRRCRSGSGGCA